MRFGVCIAVIGCRGPSATARLGVLRARPWQRAGPGHVGRGGMRTGKSGSEPAGDAQPAPAVDLTHVKPARNFFR